MDQPLEELLRDLEEQVLLALDALMGCWARWDLHQEYYLDRLAPQIVEHGVPPNARDNEAQAISALRQCLEPDSWTQLPLLLRARREQLLRQQREREKAQREREAARREREEALRELPALVDDELRTGFLELDEWFQAHPLARHLPDNWLDERKTAFVQEWALATLQERLDPQQARAVGEVGNALVTARAGSGKTRTLVTRAVFLIRHCAIPPEAVLLVAFNAAAAEEIRRRLREILPANTRLPFVMTFHALAHALVHPQEELIADTEQRPVLSSLIQTLINRVLGTADGAMRVRAAMLEYFSAEWKALEQGGLTEGREAYLRRQLESSLETLNGDFVKSYGEKLIANVLFTHDVNYRYESAVPWGKINYRPDFAIMADGKPVLIVEYFGRAGDPDYDGQAAAKRKFWESRRETLIELTVADIARGSEHCTQWLLERLRQNDIAYRELSPDEVWERASRRAVDRFSQSVTGFINRARQHPFSPDELDQRIDQHSPLDASEAAFLFLAQSLYRDYVEELRRQQVEDFTGLMWRAVRHIADGNTAFIRDRGRQSGDLRSLRFILVDEFQDFSKMFSELLKNTVEVSRAHVFAVGDDWQAINGFAGADLAYFNSFSDAYPAATLLPLTTNYRSPRRVVDLGNEIMRGLGAPARANSTSAGSVLITNTASDTGTARETNRFAGDASTPALLRLVRREISAGASSVAVLVRRKSPPWRVQDAEVRRSPETLDELEAYLRSQCSDTPDVTIEVSTAHSFKGREADCIIIADANRGAYPLLHPAWSFTRIFGDSESKLLAEERRLFYVASTRAQGTLIYLVSGAPSPFLLTESMKRLATELDLDTCPRLPTGRNGWVEVRVINTYEAKDAVKGLGFRWSQSMKVWHQRVHCSEVDDFRRRLEEVVPPHAIIEVVTN